KVAKGEEESGKSGPQPAGSNLRELRWNDELASVAKAWSQQCSPGHDCADCRSLCSRDYKVGQNILIRKNNNSEYNWGEVVKAFSYEVVNLPNYCIASYAQPENPDEPYSHYTQ
ncbi:unnamed protein product, partial [Meganyctiphanes norvegica]